VREPLPPKPGHVAKEHSEYERKGAANVFMAVEPLAGQRTTQVTERRTRVDWAHFVQMLLMTVYPLAKKVVLVMNNLNTHGIASFYEAFAPEICPGPLEPIGNPLHAETRKLAQHGRNGIERAVPTMPRPPHRRPRVDGPRNRGVAIRTQRRQCTNQLEFRSADARIKLKRLYPSFGV